MEQALESEFFGYPKALEIFKDEKHFGGDRLDQATNRVVNEADRIVESILEKDANVFEELMGTEEFYVFHDGDNEAMTVDSDHIKRIYWYFKDKDWEKFGYKELAEHTDFLGPSAFPEPSQISCAPSPPSTTMAARTPAPLRNRWP